MAFVNSKRTIRALLVLGAAALVLIVAFAESWWGKKGPGTPDTASLTLSEDQLPGVVSVAAAELPQPGYIVVQEELDGEPGIVVGVTPYIESGRAEDVNIPLSRSFSGTERFYVSVRGDNGDGRFKQIDDGIMNDTTGKPVQTTIMVQGAGVETLDVVLPESVHTD